MTLVDGSFLQKLKPIYHYYSKGCRYPTKKITDSLLLAETFIYSSEKKVIAMFKYHRMCRKKYYFAGMENKWYSRPMCFDALVKYIWDKKNLLVFKIMLMENNCTYFIINEQLEIAVFYEDKRNGNYYVVPVSEYLDKVGIDYLNARGARIKN